MAEADKKQSDSVKDHQYLRWDMSTEATGGAGFFLGYGFGDTTKSRRLSERGPHRQMKNNREMWPMTRHAAMQYLRRCARSSGEEA